MEEGNRNLPRHSAPKSEHKPEVKGFQVSYEPMKAREEVEYIDKPIEPLKHYFVITDKPITLSSEDRMYGMQQYTRDDSVMEECHGLATHDHVQGYFSLHDPEHCYLQGSD